MLIYYADVVCYVVLICIVVVVAVVVVVVVVVFLLFFLIISNIQIYMPGMFRTVFQFIFFAHFIGLIESVNWPGKFLKHIALKCTSDGDIYCAFLFHSSLYCALQS